MNAKKYGPFTTLLRQNRNATRIDDTMEALGVTERAVRYWLDARRCPPLGIVPLLAIIFCIPPSTLAKAYGEQYPKYSDNIEVLLSTLKSAQPHEIQSAELKGSQQHEIRSAELSSKNVIQLLKALAELDITPTPAIIKPILKAMLAKDGAFWDGGKICIGLDAFIAILELMQEYRTPSEGSS